MYEDLGKLVLRLGIGVLLLLHGVDKLFHGIGFIEGILAAQGIPSFLAYGVYIGEVIAPIMVILGWQTRLFAWVIVFNMAIAMILVHPTTVLSLGDHGGWGLELPGLFLVAALAVALLGAGKQSLDGLKKRAEGDEAHDLIS